MNLGGIDGQQGEAGVEFLGELSGVFRTSASQFGERSSGDKRTSHRTMSGTWDVPAVKKSSARALGACHPLFRFDIR